MFDRTVAVESHKLNRAATASCTCCSRHSVMLPADTFQMTHRLSTFCLPKLWQRVESDYKLTVFVIHGDKYYIINSSCKFGQNI